MIHIIWAHMIWAIWYGHIYGTYNGIDVNVSWTWSLKISRARLKPFKLLINMAAADLLILLNGIIKIKREMSYELSLDTWMGTSKLAADGIKTARWKKAWSNHWPNQGSTYGLGHAPVGASWCDIFRIYWCWCGALRDFLVRGRSVDPWDIIKPTYNGIWLMNQNLWFISHVW